MRWLDSISNSTDKNESKLGETVEEQSNLECCSPWGHKKSDTT